MVRILYKRLFCRKLKSFDCLKIVPEHFGIFAKFYRIFAKYDLITHSFDSVAKLQNVQITKLQVSILTTFFSGTDL
jgi:hypothetical protein